MATGSDALPLPLPPGSDSNPLLLQLFDVMAGDGMLDSGDGVSDTLEEWQEHGACFFFICLINGTSGQKKPNKSR